MAETSNRFEKLNDSNSLTNKLFNKFEECNELWKTVKDKKQKDNVSIINADTHVKYVRYSNSLENRKKKSLLCDNIIKNGFCSYGNLCLYAHNLDEQVINEDRKIVYDIIDNKTDLSNINLHQENQLFKTMQSLTKLCENCIKNKCKGGYNCKYGACSIRYAICLHDLMTGSCNNIKCKFIHLTKQGLIPYNYKEKKSYVNVSQTKINELTIEHIKTNKQLNFNKIISDGINLKDIFNLSNTNEETDNDNIDFDKNNIDNDDDTESLSESISIFD